MIEKSKGDVLFLVGGILLGKLIPGDLASIKEFWDDPEKRPWLVNSACIVFVAGAMLYVVSRGMGE